MLAGLITRTKADLFMLLWIGPSGKKFSVFLIKILWNLYKATTKFCGLSRQVVSHDTENKHDFVKTVPDKCWNLCVFDKTSPVLLYRFHCLQIFIQEKNVANKMAAISFRPQV